MESAPPQFHPPRPDPVNLKDIHFKVLTYDTIQKVIEKEGVDTLYIALTWEDYLALGDNMNRLSAYIKGTNALLCYYRKDVDEVMCSGVKTDVEQGD